MDDLFSGGDGGIRQALPESVHQGMAGVQIRIRSAQEELLAAVSEEPVVGPQVVE